MKKFFESGMIIFAVLGFWGMLYPDLCFTQDVCRVIYENNLESGEESEKMQMSGLTTGNNGKDIFTQICEAEPEQIRIESKLLDFLERKRRSNVGNDR